MTGRARSFNERLRKPFALRYGRRFCLAAKVPLPNPPPCAGAEYDGFDGPLREGDGRRLVPTPPTTTPPRRFEKQRLAASGLERAAILLFDACHTRFEACQTFTRNL